MENPFKDVYAKINDITKAQDRSTEFPLLVDMELVSNCNLNCVMCEHTYTRREHRLMSDEVLEAIIGQCAPYKPGIRFIMYSEPFLHPKIISFAKRVKAAGMLLHITNNGTVITKEQIDELVEIGLDSITFSMQGLTEEEYAFIRRHDRLPEITEKIKYISQKGAGRPHIQVSTTISGRDNQENVGKFKNMWLEWADLVTVGRTSWAFVEQLEPKIYEIAEVQKERNRKHVPCHDVLTKMSIYSSGDITVCCADISGKLTMGNVLKDNMKELWSSDTYKSMRQLLGDMRMDLFDLCKNCYPAYEY